MYTQEEVEYLIKLPKKIIENGEILEIKNYSFQSPIVDRIDIVTSVDDNYSFFIDIKQTSKNKLKLTLHFQENDINIGLFRIDFNGRHKNPEFENSTLPEIFKPYIGKWIEESHIHYYVEGYKLLIWAIPLSIDSICSDLNFNDITDFEEIFKTFCKIINLETKLILNIQTQIL